MLYFKAIDDCDERRDVQHSAGIKLLVNAIWNEYNLKITEDDIYKGDNGKPFLKNYPEIHFSISHTDGAAVCLLSDCNCGVDIEAIRQARMKAAKRVFTKNEMNYMLKFDDCLRDVIFTKIWTLKEAYSKFDGRGIIAMSKAEFDLSGDKLKTSVDAAFYTMLTDDNRYVISVCAAQCGEITLIKIL